MRPSLIDRRRLLIGLLHLGLIAVSLTIASLLRFDFSISWMVIPLFYRALCIALLVKMGVFYLARLHRRSWWQFADIVDLYHLFTSNALASIGFAAISMLLPGRALPWSIYCIDFLVCFLLTAGAGFSVRLYNEGVVNGRPKNSGKGILIYGAGVAGTMLVREVRNNPRLSYKVIGFLDDDLSKRGAILMGVPVLGTGRDAARIVDLHKRGHFSRVQEIVIAIPSANAQQMQDILTACRTAGVSCKTVPSHGELLSGKAPSAKVLDLAADDLLGRAPVQLNEDRIRSSINGRSVLVTGAAGSIGSELCRQIARFEPRKLIAFDRAETDLFKLDLEMRKNFPALHLLAEIGDIQETDRVKGLISQESIESVFHAAAYKHVPVMETHVLEAVKNNILGTWNLVRAAHRNCVSDFVMISTDKAVRPTSVMGATKRVAELIASVMPVNGTWGETKFVSVRFGNVLGSSGSVVPIFQAQIAAGGPVTVTHPDARRYFMTVREAVQLILQASTMGKGSEIFVLDMGEPIRIMDLARNMIRLSGFVPDQEIEIRFVGLRPGEKICEELITEGENILPTYHEKIKIFQGPRLSLDLIEAWIAELKVLLEQGDESAVLGHLRGLVPEYEPAEVRSRVERRERLMVARGGA
jgi:FlaA1/EpsC-like NDP-sugar epimerase